MKKSLLIITLSFIVFNLFGQIKPPETIHRQLILNVGSGIGFISKYDNISIKPLISVGFDYKAGFDFKRIEDSRLYFSIGVRLTNQFAQNTLLNENLMYFTIPIGATFEKRINSNFACNVQFGSNLSTVIGSNDVFTTNRFSDTFIGLGCTFNEKFGVDFRYNSLGYGIEYIDINNETASFPNNTYVLIFNYIIHQISQENHRILWF